MSEFRIRRVHSGNWKKWARVVMRTMRATLPREVCLSAHNMRFIFKNRRSIALLVTENERFVGFGLGYFDTLNEYPEVATIGDANIFHLCINIVAPEFQGKGVGQKLLEERIAMAKKFGAHTCTSFARNGASLHNMRKVGGKVIGVRNNWHNSGETFRIVRINIT